MRRASLTIRLIGAMAAALLAAAGARAETSSWAGRNDGPAEPAPAAKKKAEPKAAPAKIIKTVPGTPTVLPTLAPPAAPSSATAPAAPAPPVVQAAPKAAATESRRVTPF